MAGGAEDGSVGASEGADDNGNQNGAVELGVEATEPISRYYYGLHKKATETKRKRRASVNINLGGTAVESSRDHSVRQEYMHLQTGIHGCVNC
jgi:hypothetical protein